MHSIIQCAKDLGFLKFALLRLAEGMDTIKASIHNASTQVVVVDQQPSFLYLPRELRDEILSYLLVSDTEVRPYSAASVSLHPSILGSCKQLHEEGIEYLYRKNSFVLDEPFSAMQFFTREFQCSRSRITEMTLNLGFALPRLDRRGHPNYSHAGRGWQENYENLRELALSILHWSMALENVPVGMSSLTVVQYDFLEHCRHIQIASPSNTLRFCAGCAFTQFARDHPVEQFLPSALAGRVRFTQGPQCLISYDPDATPHLSHWEARVRREELKEIIARRVVKIYNRS